MNLFLSLFMKLFPIYAIIFIGFLLGRKHPGNRNIIATLLIYVLSPMVVFNAVYNTPLTAQNFLLPVFFFFVCSLISIVTYLVNPKTDHFRGILAFTAGNGNTGYFGLPVAIALFGEHIAGLTILCAFGFIIYENTVGFFLAARGKLSTQESVKKLFKLPALYAFIAAIIAQMMHLKFGEVYASFMPHFKGSYIILGSLIIGLSLSELKMSDIQLSLIAKAFFIKFLLWPVIICLCILLDQHHFHFYSTNLDYYRIAFLMAIVPLAANTVAFASLLNAEPEKAGCAVLSSTIFAQGYIPIMMSTVLPYLLSMLSK